MSNPPAHQRRSPMRRQVIVVVALLVAFAGVGSAPAYAYTLTCAPFPEAQQVGPPYLQAANSLTEPSRTLMINAGQAIGDDFGSRGMGSSGAYVQAILQSAYTWQFEWSCAQATFLPTNPPDPILPPTPPSSTTVAGHCSIVFPSTVAITKPYTLLQAALGADCAASGATYAWWNTRHSYYGPHDYFIFDGQREGTSGFYDWEHYGTYYIEPYAAWDASLTDLTQNTRSYVVKSGSGVGVTAARVGSYVTLSVWATYYSPAADAFRMWPREKVQLQYRACPTCAWTYLRNVYTASNGRITYRAYAAHTRYYRAVSATAPSIWGRTSQVIIR